MFGTAVVPCVGTWIEIDQFQRTYGRNPVVPCVGTWIEIEYSQYRQNCTLSSSPAWGRGLK